MIRQRAADEAAILNAQQAQSPAVAERTGRDDLTCLSLEPCASCSSSSGNATAPDVPAPMNVIDLGAPTSLALDIAGECRDALPPAGAN